MSDPRPAPTPKGVIVLETIAVAAVYVLGARVSQLAALPPGNVSPVWIPAGVMLAWVILRGRHLLVGVALGAALGNALGWLDSVSAEMVPRAVIAAMLNGIGDVCSVAIGAHFYRRSDDGVPLGDPRTLLVFLLAAAVVGPLVSALFGVGGLVWSGLAPLDTAHVLVTTWWAGDGVGALVLGPTILFVANDWSRVRRPDRRGERLGVVGASLGAAALWAFALAPVWVEIGDLMVFVIVAWVAVRFRPSDTLLTLTPLVAARIVVAFTTSDPTSSVREHVGLLTELIVFIALVSVASILIASSVDWHRRNRTRLREALADNARVLRLQDAAIRSVANIVFVTDADGRIEWVNDAFERRTGFSAEEAIGQPASIIGSGAHPREHFAGLWETIRAGDVWRGRMVNRSRAGERFTVDQTVTPIRDSDGQVRWYVAVQTDAGDLLQDRDRLIELATHDDLTGLANRARVRIALERLCLEARRMGDVLAVAMIDLDRFKPINDTWGHPAGDEVLVAVAQRMRGAVRDMDIVARTGGDEFVVILPRVDSGDDARTIAERLVATIVAPITIRSLDGRLHDVTVGASVGVAATPIVEPRPDVLLAAADRAMYRAKSAGGGAVRCACAEDAEGAAGPARLPRLEDDPAWLERLTQEHPPLAPDASGD